ncbi:MAG TPA: DinB family protein [Candidatus Acidoferrales bacterium]|nr:DinB family protein [Candidatus Acidoferrales bacterium]
MRRFPSAILLALCVVMLFPHPAAAQDKPATAAAAPAVTGARGEFLAEIAFYEQRYIRLAEAVPAEKFSWRPAEGVRSIGEVYAHIAAANYGVARALGTPPPAGFDPKALNALAADKAKTVQALKDSFAHFRSAILAIKDADLNNAQKLFGQDTTVRGAFFMITGHFGEHLGQSIAYARQNGIVPPWTEERQKQEAAKPKP